MAWADEGVVDQAEGLDIEQGAIELELQTIYIPASNGDADVWKIAPTLEYGLSSSLGIGVEIEFEKESGESLIFEELGLLAKWVALSPEEAPLGLGLQSALIIDRHGGIGTETYAIAEITRAGTGLTANLIYATEPGDWSEDSLSYVLRGDQAFSERFSLGAEAGGELSGAAKGRHWIGPVVTFAPGREDDTSEGGPLPAIEFALFAPLTRATPDVQFRLELDWEF